MPLNRNNNEVCKSFAVGTKIEYMNKLFEVVESNSCCDCSIASICSSSDLSASDRNDDILSRDKRINIFGECSSVRRPDSKSIVFAEMVLIASKIKSKEKDHWIKDNDWRDVVLDLKELSYHFSFVNDIAAKDWGGNLENIIEDFLMEYKP